MPGTSRENTAWMEEVISRTPRSNFLNTAVRWMYSQTIFLSTFDRFALILQAEEIVDVINDLQQAIVSQQSRPLCPLYIICIDIIIRSVYHDVPCYNALQYTAMFVKDPAEKEEKMGDVTSKTLPQGLLRWWRRWGREITWWWHPLPPLCHQHHRHDDFPHQAWEGARCQRRPVLCRKCLHLVHNLSDLDHLMRT